MTDLQIFEDGLIECWKTVDLPMFKKELKRGWVQGELPTGEVLSVHNLAQLTIGEAEWEMTSRQLLARVKQAIKHLNPGMSNQFDMNGSETEMFGQMPVAKMPRAGYGTYHDPNPMPFFRSRIKGTTKWGFWQGSGQTDLVSISIFMDGKIRINGSGAPIEMSWEEFQEDRRLVSADEGDRIRIAGLGEFVADKIELQVLPDGIRAELEMARGQLDGGESLMRLAAKAYRRYADDPTQATLEELREAYETVPEHLRMYCGDMDTRDIPIRIALYGEEEIENWSHRQIAKQRGEPLPGIYVPKPKD